MDSDDLGLEKAVWSDADFGQMGWHDATIHALGFRDAGEHEVELLLDLDSIARWVKSDSGWYSFLVAPATLVFDNVHNVRGTLALDGEHLNLHVNDIERLEHESEGAGEPGFWRWKLDGHDFTLSFSATGFRQYFRARPMATHRQALLDDERGGVSFDRRGYD
jgi:hypothetical protein